MSLRGQRYQDQPRAAAGPVTLRRASPGKWVARRARSRRVTATGRDAAGASTSERSRRRHIIAHCWMVASLAMSGPGRVMVQCGGMG